MLPKSSFLQYLPLFWPVRQSRAAVEPNLSLSQNTADMHIIIHGYASGDASIELLSLNLGLLSKQHALPTP